MPISTTCAECLVELQLPDRLAGMKIECPECSSHIRVPGGEKQTRKAEHAAREEEGECENRPRKKLRRDGEDEQLPQRRKKKSEGPSRALLIGIPVGILALVGIAAGTIYLVSAGRKRAEIDAFAAAGTKSVSPASNGDSDQPLFTGIPGLDPNVPNRNAVTPLKSNRIALPTGWVDFQHPKKLYSVYLPGKPQLTRSTQKPPANSPFANVAYIEETYHSQPTKDNWTICGIDTVTGPPGSLQVYVNGPAPQGAANLFPGVTWTTTQLTWAGYPAVEMITEMELSGMVSAVPGAAQLQQNLPQNGLGNKIPQKTKLYTRHVLVGEKVLIFTIHNPQGIVADTDRSTFYDSVVFGR